MTIFLSILFAAVLFLTLDLPVLAQGWPSRPIRVLVPFAPSGSSGVAGRSEIRQLNLPINLQ